MHLVLGCFERDTGYYACRLYALCRARFAVSGNKTALKYLVEWVLHASETLCGVIVFIMYVQIVATHGVFCFGCKQIVIYKWLCSLAGKFHHHSCRRVGVHICIFTRDVVVFCLNDFKENVACLSTACSVSLVAICNVFLCHLFARAAHQFKLHLVLDFLYRHTLLSTCPDTVGYALYQCLVFAFFGLEHRFAYCSLYLLFVVAHYSAITFHYYLYHLILSGLFMLLVNSRK